MNICSGCSRVLVSELRSSTPVTATGQCRYQQRRRRMRAGWGELSVRAPVPAAPRLSTSDSVSQMGGMTVQITGNVRFEISMEPAPPSALFGDHVPLTPLSTARMHRASAGGSIPCTVGKSRVRGGQPASAVLKHCDICPLFLSWPRAPLPWSSKVPPQCKGENIMSTRICSPFIYFLSSISNHPNSLYTRQTSHQPLQVLHSPHSTSPFNRCPGPCAPGLCLNPGLGQTSNPH